VQGPACPEKRLNWGKITDFPFFEKEAKFAVFRLKKAFFRQKVPIFGQNR
jgi:hypothetical protein